MAKPTRVVHYLNQFFGSLGGEEKADLPIEARTGAVGPARALQSVLGDRGEVVATLIGGDNYVSERSEEAAAAMRQALAELRPDVVVAGPAFDAGRYGLACAQVCLVAEELGIPSVTAMYPENPGFTTFRRHLICVPTGLTPVDMAKVVGKMAAIALKLAQKVPLGSAADEGYLPRGFRKPVLRAKSGAARAVDMVLAQVNHQPFTTEIPVLSYDRVPPAPPVADLTSTRLAVITSGGLVPRGNPDHLVSARAQEFFRYAIADRSALVVGEWESVHGGYSTRAVNTRNPNFVVPLDVLQELVAQKAIGSLYPDYFVTVGNQTAVSDARRMGAQIAEVLLTEKVGAALLVAT